MTPKKQRKVIKKPIYLLDPKLSWKVFKELHDKLVKDYGPVPVHGDKVLWQMMRDRKIYCWFDFVNFPNDMGVGLKLPENREIKVITNPPKK